MTEETRRKFDLAVVASGMCIVSAFLFLYEWFWADWTLYPKGSFNTTVGSAILFIMGIYLLWKNNVGPALGFFKRAERRGGHARTSDR